MEDEPTCNFTSVFAADLRPENQNLSHVSPRVNGHEAPSSHMRVL